MSKKTKQMIELKEACEQDLWTFAQMIEPKRMYGDVHKALFWFLQYGVKEEQLVDLSNYLVLLPRAHQKSHIAAVLAAWLITRDPTHTILYISATATLAEKQLYAIKNILTSDIYRRLWPEMVNEEEGKREKWSTGEICVDHPKRKEEGVRDSTVFAAGLTTTTTGLHFDTLIKDDVVSPENAYTQEGRAKVSRSCSQLASIQNPDSSEYTFGTRYHQKDHYNTVKDMQYEIYNDEGDLINKCPMYKVFEKVVETDNDFLWPKMYREDGKWFGFDWKVLAEKKGKYEDVRQFWAQYYNDPNNRDEDRLDRSRFQYYDRSKVACSNGAWSYMNRKLNVFAAIDFAFSLTKSADYTAIVVVGVDHKGHIYILDIERFKTNKMEEYFQRILNLHSKYNFRKLRAEVTVAQKAIVEYLKDRARERGMSMSIDEFRPSAREGSKEERIAATLEPRYMNQTIWHYQGGYCSMLEEELILERPKHDDLKDVLSMVVEIAKAPMKRHSEHTNVSNIKFHPRFGGVC